ncbi:MAG: FtsX-like permease family protein, partial [Bacteroidia bacterium]|nr:FtsX-like permease family protein [Bacteroidia bacterium]
MLKNYLKIAFRNVQDEASYDRFHQKLEQIYRVNTNHSWGGIGSEGSISCLAVSPVLKKELPEVEAFVRLNQESFLVRQGDKAHVEEVHHVEANFFTVFDFPLLMGDPETALRGKNNLVLTEDMAKKYFGITQVVGKTLLLEVDEKFESFTISGVTENPPFNSSIRFNFLLSFQRIADKMQGEDILWMQNFINSFVLLKPGTDAEEIKRKMPAIIDRYSRAGVEKVEKMVNEEIQLGYTLQPFSEVHVSTEIGNSNGLEDAHSSTYAYVLLGIATFILLIACINFTNLSLAQSLPRAKEIGVRKVIGASRLQLIFQFLGESFMLCFLAMLLGLALAELALPIFNQLTNKKLSFHYLADYQVPLVGVGLLLMAAFLAGIYPALVLSNFEPVKALKGKQRIGNRQVFTKVLVVSQFALSVFLIIVMLAFTRQMN